MTLIGDLLVRAGLRFADPHDEQEFHRSFVVAQKRYIQVALLMGGVIFYVFFVWDRIIDPVGWDAAHAIRGLVVSPGAWAIALTMSFGFADRRMELLQISALMLSVGGLTAIYWILARGYDFGGIGLVIIDFFAFSMMSMRLPAYVVYCLLSTVAFNAGQHLAANSQPGMMLVNNLSILTSVFLGLYSATLKELAARRKFSADRELHAARTRIDDLLHSMLPREIVARIQAGEQSIADLHGEVSIVFADMVNFTTLSRTLSPRRLVEILNEMFSSFDLEAERYGVERIKTIGDAYMAVCGLVREMDDHAERAANFAFAMHGTVKEMSERLGYPIDIRVGLHVGPIVSGVIGTKRPAFDCWGEAVNVASRLEHTASPGGILVSEAAHWRLGQIFHTTALEEVELKGIGLSKVFLLRRRDQQPPDPVQPIQSGLPASTSLND